MRAFGLASFLLLISVFSLGQIIDEVRLTFDPAKVKAKQLSAAASSDGKYLAFGYNNGSVKVFDVSSQKFRSIIPTGLKEFHDIRITNDGKIIVTAFSDLKVFDAKTGAALKVFKLKGRMARTDFNAQHNIYVVGQMGGNLTTFDLTSLVELYSGKFGGMMINALAIDPEAKYVAAALYKMGGKFPVKLIDIRTGEVTKEFDKEIYHTASFDRNGKLLLYGWGTGTFFFHVYDPSFQVVKKFETKMQTYGYVEAAFSGTRAIFTTASLTLDVYDIEEEKLVYTSMADRSLMKIIGNYAYPRIIRLNDTKFMFTYGNDNISRIYDTTTNDVVAYFYNDGDSKFCVVSKNGMIDGDLDAMNSVFWTSRKSKLKTSLEQTFEHGFTPKLFSIIVDQKNVPQQHFDIEGLASDLPSVRISAINGKAFKSGGATSSVQKNIKVDVALSGNISDVREVRFYHNGKMVRAMPASGSQNYIFDVTLNNSFGTGNFIGAVAITKAGIESEKTKAVIEYNGAADGPPKIYLVTVGINEYKNPKYNLNYAMADADGVQKTVQSTSSSLFSEVISYSIRNDKAQKENIYKTLEEIKGKALEQDLLIVYYAGHGVVSDHAGTAEFFLVLHDVTQLYGKPEQLQQRAISASEIRALTQGINAQKQLFLLDACQSGAALESAATKRGVEEERAIAQLARSTGTFWITASGSTQFATEIEKLGHGIFTYAILEGMDGKADGNKDGKLTVRELSSYIEEQVPLLTEQHKGSAQYPSSYSFGNDFPIRLY